MELSTIYTEKHAAYWNCCQMTPNGFDAWMKHFIQLSILLTEVFSAVLAFFEPSYPVKLCKLSKQNLVTGLRRTKLDRNHKVEAKRSDWDILNFISREIQTSLLEMKSRASLEAYGLSKRTEGLETSPNLPEAPSRNNESLKEIVQKSLKEFSLGKNWFSIRFWTESCQVWQTKIHLPLFIDQSTTNVRDPVRTFFMLQVRLGRPSLLLLSKPHCSDEVEE